MNGQEILGNVAFYVSIAVVIGMAIMFSILFAIYGFYKIKHINYGHEDDKLEQTLRHRYKEIIERNSEEGLKTKTIVDKDKVNEPDYVMVQNMRNVKTFTLVGEKEVEKPLEPKTVLEAIFEEKRKSKKWRVVSNVFFAIFYVLLLILLGFSIAFKVTNQQLYIGNSGLVAIYTGSMETMNDENTYLEEEGLTSQEDRIMQYSLIGVDKVSSPVLIQDHIVIVIFIQGRINAVRRIRLQMIERGGLHGQTYAERRICDRADNRPQLHIDPIAAHVLRII